MHKTRNVFAYLFLVFILAGTLAPAQLKDAAVGFFPTAFHVEKLGHMFGFAGFVYCFSVTRGTGLRWSVMFLALALGIGTELAQNLVTGRDPALDVALDMTGAVLGLWLAFRDAKRFPRAGRSDG